jgi:transcription antitermination protein NusB
MTYENVHKIMPVPQQKFREIVFQLLYSHDIGQAEERDMLALMMAELAVSRKAVRDAQAKMIQVTQHLKNIDQCIAKSSHGYAFERIQSVERNILRIGVYELLYDKTIPPKVAIAEALRLERKFGSPEGASFVNALLDNIYKASQGLKIDDHKIVESVQNLQKRDEEIKHDIQRVIEQRENDAPF